MVYRCALEDIEPNHWIVWVLDLPACFSSGKTEKVALKGTPLRIAEHHKWLSAHDPTLPVPTGPFDLEIIESFRSFPSPEDPDYLVNAFFMDDRRPLSNSDADLALRLFEWTRADLMNVLDRTRPDQLHAALPGEIHNSILGIVEHMARAENWYFEQLDLGLEPSEIPNGALEKLEVFRANTRSQLMKFIDSDRVVEHYGERWSPRKVIRRALWHERDHTQHIAKILSTLP